MNKNALLSLIIIMVAQWVSFDCVAQESTLWLRNGKKITISNYKVESDDYYESKISYTTADGKQKSKYLEDVFSVVDKAGNEKVLYMQNVEFGELLTPEQMKHYVMGVGDARVTKVSPFILMGGIASGLVGAFIPPLEINLGESSMPIPLGILVPAAYIGVMGATPPNADKLQANYPVKEISEHYLMGYQEGVKKKRLKNSIIGSAAGFIAGMVIFVAVN